MIDFANNFLNQAKMKPFREQETTNANQSVISDPFGNFGIITNLRVRRGLTQYRY